MTRRGYLLIAALAVPVAMAANWWLGRYRDEAPVAPTRVEPRVNYALVDFEAEFFDAEGRSTLRVTGPALEHYADTRNARITQPRFSIDPDGEAWSGQADHGRVERDAETLVLAGHARIRKPHPRGMITILSGELHYNRPSGIVRSPGPARIRQAGTELSGGTLTVWIEDKRMELNQDVHAIYRAADRGAGTAGGQRRRRPADG